ncbi:hypothetical protein D0Z07_9312 [Hyphodiscus hymeniophilus]|uniref:Uncharacterized protein n=1 Tax=Hyphodiscus hymeniophilus TaxID=353542 RepID=A0A9P6SPD6_9HELO|nr:hypothetical protein D0Z07_9312 [Hyphodiscus hymeniophilus]
MTSLSALGFDIREPYRKVNAKCAILNLLWGSNFTTGSFAQDPLLGEAFLRYCNEQCRTALARQDTVLSTHQDIVDIIRKLQDPLVSRDDLKDDLRRRRAPHAMSLDDYESVLSEAIDLGVRLWLMFDVGEMLHSFVPGQKSLVWEAGFLKGLVQDHFSTHSTIRERVKLDRIFNARNLERIGGLQIVWTSNLADHLRLMADDTRVAIFHHASFLEYHQNNHFFPAGLIDETSRTLSLLLPQYDVKSRKWFRIHKNKWYLDENAASCGHLTTEQRQIENFVFWHDRLTILKQVFDEAEPSSISQWWCDRRRRVQWYTFWVAAIVLGLTIFFGMIQCIEVDCRCVPLNY